jgi:hypothetical protein
MASPNQLNFLENNAARGIVKAKKERGPIMMEVNGIEFEPVLWGSSDDEMEYTEKDEWYDEHCEESPLPVPKNPQVFRRTKRADSTEVLGIAQWLASQNTRFDN